MSEVVIKDSSIKLFGRTILLPPNNEDSSVNGFSSDEPAPPPEDCSHHSPPSSSSSFPREVSSTMEHEAESYKEPSRKELTSTQEEEASHETSEEPKSPTSSCILENPKTPSTERETSLLKSSKNGDQSDTTTTTSVSQDKTLKKPDKVLPCPRCNSMDTKFCYYNNYNVNQPRHFCKHCQRYWTAGGTMRNVPVGAGRRKNKNSSSVPQPQHYGQIMAFGSDHSPLSESVASVLSLAEKTTQNGVLNGFHSPKQNTANTIHSTNGDEHQYECDANVMASTFKEKRDNATISHEESLESSHMSYHHHNQGFTTPQLCFPGSSTSSSSSPWPYPWNPAMPPSAFCHHVPFYPTPAFWGCMPQPSWSVNYQSAPGSGPNSPTLGKHSRDGDILFQNPTSTESKSNMEENSTVLIPKTLRIDDPAEAAKSSIWSTLGIDNEKRNSLNGGGLFKAFASKGSDDNNKNNHVMVEAASPVLQANPAALSRFLVFHERT